MTKVEKKVLYTGRLIATAILLWALHKAQTAGLISSTLQIPVSYLGFAYFGWWLKKTVNVYRSEYRWKHRKY